MRARSQGSRCSRWLPAAMLSFVLWGSASPGWADFQFAGVVDSWEWLTDASTVIVKCEAVIAPQPAEGRQVCRVKEVYKQPKDSALKAGGELRIQLVKIQLVKWEKWHKDRELLLFLGGDRQTPLGLVPLPPGGALPEPTEDHNEYLLPDKEGRAIRKTDELLEKINQRVAHGRTTTPDGSPKVDDAGFDYWPGGEIDSNDEYYHVRVPPDEDLRPLVEQWAKRKDFEGRSVLYRYYTERSPVERADDREQDVAHMLREASSLAAPCVTYRSVITYPDNRLVSLSPDLRFAAVLAGEQVRLYLLADHALLLQLDGVYRGRRNAFRGMIFSPDSRYFASLKASGDVSIVDIAARKLQSTGKLGWTMGAHAFPEQFSFSPNAKYVVLNLDRGPYDSRQANSVVVWKADTGERLFTKSPAWEPPRTLSIVGFHRHSETIQVTESSFWDLKKGTERDHAGGGWDLPNKVDPFAEAAAPTISAFEVPGARLEKEPAKE